jgi:hypothetical protein
LIEYTGEDVNKWTNKSQVHESYGTPTSCGNADGREFEEFETHRKISDPNDGALKLFLGLGTCGLSELWFFPVSLVGNTFNALAGQTVRFEYGNEGEVQRVLVNGKRRDDGEWLRSPLVPPQEPKD